MNFNTTSKTFFLTAAAIVVCLVTASWASPTVVGIYTNGRSIESTADIFKGADFEVHTVLNESFADFCKGKGNVLVIPADEILHHSVRPDLHKFMQNAGSLIILNRDAMNYDKYTISAPVKIESRKQLTSLSNSSEYKIIKADSSNLKISECGKGICIYTDEGEEIGGSKYIEIPANFDKSLLSKGIELEIKGDIQLDILSVKILDKEGNSWIGFAEMSHYRDKYILPLADMLGEKGNSKSVSQIDPSKINRIQVGLDNRVIWGEAGGRVCIERISLIRYDRNRYPLSDNITRYRAQFKAVGAEYPDWLFSPIVCSQIQQVREAELASHIVAPQGRFLVEGTAASLNTTRTYPGGNPESFLDVIKRNAFRPIPLIKSRTFNGETDNLAQLNVYSDGDYAGACVAMFGLSAENYKNELVASLIRKTAQYMSQAPKILDCTPDTETSRTQPGQYDFRYRVYVYNPQTEPLEATFALDLAGGILTAQSSEPLEAGGITRVILNAGNVPRDFPFTKFAINLTLNSAAGNDVLNHNIDVEKTLTDAAEHLIAMQPINFIDSAYTHWFYSDAYAARMLRGLGEHLDNQNYINSAMRWAAAMVATQLENGAYPMGYGMKRGIYYIADNGSIALAIAQLASYTYDIERRAFLDRVSRAYDWRDSYLVTPERSEELQEIFGEGAVGTQVGNYGVGTVGQDHVTGGEIVYETVQPEYRGVWYTLACTMGFPAAMIALDGGERYIQTAHADGRIYIDRELTVTGSYAPEGALWLYKYVQDEQLKSDLRDRLVDRFIGYFPVAAERFWLYQGGRQNLLINPLVYAMRNIENSTRTRAAVLESVIGLCGDYSSYSMMRVAKQHPKATFSRVNNEATMYLNFGSFGLMELLAEGSTMLKADDCK